MPIRRLSGSGGPPVLTRPTATAVLAATILVFTSGGKASADPAPPPPSIRVLDAVYTAAVQVSIDGARPLPLDLGQASDPVVVSPGTRPVTMTGPGGAAQLDVRVDDGCDTTVVAGLQRGPNNPPTLIALNDCAHQRLEPSSAGLRLIVATAASNGDVTLNVNGQEATARPWKSSTRLATTAGITTVTLRRPDGAVLHSQDIRLPDGHNLTLALIGGGTRPVQSVLLDDGGQTPEALAADTVVNSGYDPGPTSRPALAVLVAAFAAIAAWLAVRARRARRLALIVIAVASLLSGCAERRPMSVTPSANSSPNSRDEPPSRPPDGAEAKTPSPTRAASEPAALELAGRRLTVRPIEPGMLADPAALTDPEAGWITGTSRPGEPGTTIVYGHSSWKRQPGAFAPLKTIRPGDRVTLSAANNTQTYIVDRSIITPKGHLPPWLWTPSPTPRLALITCTGPADPATGLSRDNLTLIAYPQPTR